jgi:hypothetical protein
MMNDAALRQQRRAAAAAAAAHPPPPVDAKKRCFTIWAAAARGGALFRSTDAAQVCNHVGLVELDGEFECSFATAARRIVSERW